MALGDGVALVPCAYAGIATPGVKVVPVSDPALSSLHGYLVYCRGHERLATGAPVLDGAGVVFDCEVERREVLGTHRIFICAVREIRVGASDAVLIHGNRRFGRFSFQPAWPAPLFTDAYALA